MVRVLLLTTFAMSINLTLNLYTAIISLVVADFKTLIPDYSG